MSNKKTPKGFLGCFLLIFKNNVCIVLLYVINILILFFLCSYVWPKFLKPNFMKKITLLFAVLLTAQFINGQCVVGDTEITGDANHNHYIC